MMDDLTRVVEMGELMLPNPRELLIHSKPKQAAIDNSMPWKWALTIRVNKSHEPRPQF